MEYFGELLTIDAFGCSQEVIASIDKVNDFMFEAVRVAGMKIFYGPITLPYKHPVDPAEGGLSSNLILIDSHSATHTFFNHGYVSFDLYSCKPFDRKALVKLFKDTFKPTGNVKITLKKRGKGYKRSFSMV